MSGDFKGVQLATVRAPINWEPAGISIVISVFFAVAVAVAMGAASVTAASVVWSAGSLQAVRARRVVMAMVDEIIGFMVLKVRWVGF